MKKIFGIVAVLLLSVVLAIANFGDFTGEPNDPEEPEEPEDPNIDFNPNISDVANSDNLEFQIIESGHVNPSTISYEISEMNSSKNYTIVSFDRDGSYDVVEQISSSTIKTVDDSIQKENILEKDGYLRHIYSNRTLIKKFYVYPKATLFEADDFNDNQTEWQYTDIDRTGWDALNETENGLELEFRTAQFKDGEWGYAYSNKPIEPNQGISMKISTEYGGNYGGGREEESLYSLEFGSSQGSRNYGKVEIGRNREYENKTIKLEREEGVITVLRNGNEVLGTVEVGSGDVYWTVGAKAFIKFPMYSGDSAYSKITLHEYSQVPVSGVENWDGLTYTESEINSIDRYSANVGQENNNFYLTGTPEDFGIAIGTQ